MTVDAKYLQDGCTMDYTPDAALDAGDIVRLPDGRVGVATDDMTADVLGAVQVEGVFAIKKTASVVMLPGQIAWWDISAGSATHEINGDFVLGIVTADAAGTDTTVSVNLNEERLCDIDLDRPKEWTTENTDGLGVTYALGVYTLAFDAVAEVAQAALYSNVGIKKEGCPIFEAVVANYDYGDNAALDMDVGLAGTSHGTDFQAIAEFVSFHFDSGLDILAQSDDGTTDVAPVDSTLNAVDDTYLFLQIDARDSSDVKLYVNGVRISSATTFKLVAGTAALKPIVLIEKTSDNTLADFRVKALRAYRTANAA